MLFAAEGPNKFFLPADINEFYWGSIAFLVVLFFFVTKGLPLIKKAMAARSENIAADISAAEAARSDAEANVAELSANLGNAEEESAAIVEQANADAAKLKADLMARAEADVAAAKERAAAEIEATKGQALADLRAEAAARAAAAAEAVVGANLDASTQNDLVEAYISQVGGAR